MRIGLNLLHAHPGIGGGWNYIEYVLKLLGDYGGGNEYVAYCTDHSAELVPNKPGFKIQRVGISVTNRIQRIAFEQTGMQFLAWRDHLDCMHWFANTCGLVNTVPAMVTFHDFLSFENPRCVGLLKRIYLQAMVRYAARYAAISLTNSKTTADTLLSRFKVGNASVVVIPAPIGYEFTPRPRNHVEQFRQAYRLPDRFVLFIGDCHAHKNHERLFRAYARLKARRPDLLPLVLRGADCGRRELLDRQIDAAGIRPNVLWLPRLNSAEMPLLYGAATLFVFPSLYEGLGIPILEAMACGLPVVASDITTNHEFGNGALLFFDATNVDGIASAVEMAMSDSSLCERGRQKGLTLAAGVRPDKIAPRLLSAYRQVCDVVTT